MLHAYFLTRVRCTVNYLNEAASRIKKRELEARRTSRPGGKFGAPAMSAVLTCSSPIERPVSYECVMSAGKHAAR